jgi:hypothetical protein
LGRVLEGSVLFRRTFRGRDVVFDPTLQRLSLNHFGDLRIEAVDIARRDSLIRFFLYKGRPLSG